MFLHSELRPGEPPLAGHGEGELGDSKK